jgi:membrane-bound serine protease (ClpP class)
MNGLTRTRLILAIASTLLEEVAIWTVWKWALPGIGLTLSVGVLVAIMMAWAVISTGIFLFMTNILRKQGPTGKPTMVGLKGQVSRALKPEGMVLIKGELWQAEAEGGNIEKGERVMVTKESGMILTVRRT